MDETIKVAFGFQSTLKSFRFLPQNFSLAELQKAFGISPETLSITGFLDERNVLIFASELVEDVARFANKSLALCVRNKSAKSELRASLEIRATSSLVFQKKEQFKEQWESQADRPLPLSLFDICPKISSFEEFVSAKAKHLKEFALVFVLEQNSHKAVRVTGSQLKELSKVDLLCHRVANVEDFLRSRGGRQEGCELDFSDSAVPVLVFHNGTQVNVVSVSADTESVIEKVKSLILEPWVSRNSQKARSSNFRPSGDTQTGLSAFRGFVKDLLDQTVGIKLQAVEAIKVKLLVQNSRQYLEELHQIFSINASTNELINQIVTTSARWPIKAKELQVQDMLVVLKNLHEQAMLDRKSFLEMKTKIFNLTHDKSAEDRSESRAYPKDFSNTFLKMIMGLFAEYLNEALSFSTFKEQLYNILEKAEQKETLKDSYYFSHEEESLEKSHRNIQDTYRQDTHSLIIGGSLKSVGEYEYLFKLIMGQIQDRISQDDLNYFKELLRSGNQHMIAALQLFRDENDIDDFFETLQTMAENRGKNNEDEEEHNDPDAQHDPQEHDLRAYINKHQKKNSTLNSKQEIESASSFSRKSYEEISKLSGSWNDENARRAPYSNTHAHPPRHRVSEDQRPKTFMKIQPLKVSVDTKAHTNVASSKVSNVFSYQNEGSQSNTEPPSPPKFGSSSGKKIPEVPEKSSVSAAKQPQPKTIRATKPNLELISIPNVSAKMIKLINISDSPKNEQLMFSPTRSIRPSFSEDVGYLYVNFAKKAVEWGASLIARVPILSHLQAHEVEVIKNLQPEEFSRLFVDLKFSKNPKEVERAAAELKELFAVHSRENPSDCSFSQEQTRRFFTTFVFSALDKCVTEGLINSNQRDFWKNYVLMKDDLLMIKYIEGLLSASSIEELSDQLFDHEKEISTRNITKSETDINELQGDIFESKFPMLLSYLNSAEKISVLSLFRARNNEFMSLLYGLEGNHRERAKEISKFLHMTPLERAVSVKKMQNFWKPNFMGLIESLASLQSKRMIAYDEFLRDLKTTDRYDNSDLLQGMLICFELNQDKGDFIENVKLFLGFLEWEKHKQLLEPIFKTKKIKSDVVIRVKAALADRLHSKHAYLISLIQVLMATKDEEDFIEALEVM